jgi:ComF family protein
LPKETIVVPIPTALSHIRQRGYDHSQLIAKEFAKLRGLKIATPLFRAKDFRQVGVDRKIRFEQAQKTMIIKNGSEIKGKHILLVDDVCTTGATLFTAADLIKKAGASSIQGAIIAWQPPKK